MFLAGIAAALIYSLPLWVIAAMVLHWKMMLKAWL
jgi:hypothetical protein